MISHWTHQHLSAWVRPGGLRCLVASAAASPAAVGVPSGLMSPESVVGSWDDALAAGEGPFDLVVVPLQTTLCVPVEELLDRTRPVVGDHGTLVLFAAGPAHVEAPGDSCGSTDRSHLAHVASMRFPEHQIVVEHFGNIVTRSAVAACLAADAVRGSWIDDHRSDEDVLLALTVSPSS